MSYKFEEYHRWIEFEILEDLSPQIAELHAENERKKNNPNMSK